MFSTIQDVANPNISILRCERTKFYNATKTLNQFYELYPNAAQKQVNEWLRSAKTVRAINAVAQKYNIREAHFILHAGTRNEHKGTYVHPTLYRMFAMWISEDYGVDVLAVVETAQETYTTRLKAENTQLKSENIDIKDMFVRFEAKLDYVTAEATEAKFSRERVEKTLNTVVTMLKDKSIVSTMNPVNPKQHHNFVVMGYEFTDRDTGLKGHRLAHIAGQDTYVRGQIRKKLADDDHTWTIQVGMHYNANPIDLRNNIENRVKAFIKKTITDINAKRKADVDNLNKPLKEEIIQFNKAHPTARRSFKNEKHKMEWFFEKDIPINCTKLSTGYIENDFITYDVLLNLIMGVDIETKKSPYQSEDEDEASKTDTETNAHAPPLVSDEEEATDEEEISDEE